MAKFNSYNYLKDLHDKKITLSNFYREQIKILSQYANLSACCRRIGIPVQSVNNFMSGKDNAIAYNKLELLCTFLDELPCGMTDDEIEMLRKDLEIK